MKDLSESKLTKLPLKYTFWFTFFQKQKNKQLEEFEDNLKKIDDFDTIEGFWNIQQHNRRSDTLPRGSTFFLFR